MHQRHRLDDQQYAAVRETIGTMAIEHIYLSNKKIDRLIDIALKSSTHSATQPRNIRLGVAAA